MNEIVEYKNELKNLKVDAEIYCPHDCHIVRKPDPECDHVWARVRNADTYGAWECQKCHGYVEIGVWD